MILDPTSTSFTFLKTGTGAAGLLAAGNYTLTLRSATNGFKDTYGNLLDGNGDGIPGDDYITTFMVAATSSPILTFIPESPDSSTFENSFL